MARRIICSKLETPLGRLLLAHSGSGLCAVVFCCASGGEDLAWKSIERRLEARFAPCGPAAVGMGSELREAALWLGAYFRDPARSTAFGGDLDPGGTGFQRRVWDRLVEIPPRETMTYGEVARSVGHAGAARAVGAACRANPLPIFVPCHRVVGAGGRLTGFSAGLEIKKRLLEMEGNNF